MKIINGERQSGRTTMLIIASAVTEQPIVTPTREQAHFVEMEAKKMGLEIPRVWSFGEITSLQSRGHRIQTGIEGTCFLVDNAEQIIQQMLEESLGGKVSAITICAPIVRKQYNREDENNGKEDAGRRSGD